MQTTCSQLANNMRTTCRQHADNMQTTCFKFDIVRTCKIMHSHKGFYFDTFPFTSCGQHAQTRNAFFLRIWNNAWSASERYHTILLRKLRPVVCISSILKEGSIFWHALVCCKIMHVSALINTTILTRKLAPVEYDSAWQCKIMQ